MMALGLCLTLGIHAQRGSCGTGVQWVLEDGTLTISGDGDMNNFSLPAYGTPSWYIYKDNIKKVVFESGVKHIGNYTFYNYSNIKEVVISEGVKSIGDYTFYGCTGITEITFPASLEILGGKYNTRSEKSQSKNRIIGTGWAELGYNTFAGCTGLKEVTIPATVWAVGYNCFAGCSNLRSVNWNIADHHRQKFLSSSLPTYTGYSPFNGCPVESVTFGSEVDTIPNNLFNGNDELSYIKFSGNTEYIGKDAFLGTEWFYGQPNGIVYIDKVAYAYKGAMTTPTAITINEGTMSMTDGLLADQYYLTKVIIPQSMRHVGEDVFDNCSALSEVEWNAEYCDAPNRFSSTPLYIITFGNTVRSIPSSLCSDCQYIKSITLPNSVTVIQSSAFSDCSALTDIVFSENIDSIGPDAMSGCTSIKTIKLPKKLRVISSGAFNSCKNLEEVELPNSLETIGSSAFEYHSLKSLTIPENVKFIGEDAFYTSDAWGSQSRLHTLIYNAVDCEIKRSSFSSFTTFPNSILNLEIGDKVKIIPDNLCYGQKNITNVKIGRDLRYMPENCFKDCIQMASVEWNAVNAESAKTPFPPTVFEFTFGNEVESIPDDLCYEITDLKSIAIPQSVKEIGEYAFAQSGLTTIDIPDNVTTIGSSAFRNTHITSLFLQPTLTSIGSYAFADNKELTQVIAALPPIETTSGIFNNCDALKEIYVADAEGYKTINGWNSYAHLLKDMTAFDSTEYLYDGNEVSPLCTSVLPDYTIGNISTIDSMPINAGKYEVPFKIDFTGPYNFTVTVPHRFYILPCDLSVGVKNATRTYGEENPAFEYTYEGFINGEDESVLDSLPTAYCEAGRWSDVGEYTIAVSGCKAANYQIIYKNGTLQIVQAAQEIEWNQDFSNICAGDTIIFDAKSSSNLNIEYSVDNEDVAEIGWIDSLQAMMICKAEGYVTVTASQNGDKNYLEAEPVSKTILINPTSGIYNNSHSNTAEKVYANNGRIITYSIPTGTNITIYTSDGKPLHSITSDGNRMETPIKTHGIYIVRWNGKAVKLSL